MIIDDHFISCSTSKVDIGSCIEETCCSNQALAILQILVHPGILLGFLLSSVNGPLSFAALAMAWPDTSGTNGYEQRFPLDVFRGFDHLALKKTPLP